jgi:hypothetical protein
MALLHIRLQRGGPLGSEHPSTWADTAFSAASSGR